MNQNTIKITAPKGISQQLQILDGSAGQPAETALIADYKFNDQNAIRRALSLLRRNVPSLYPYKLCIITREYPKRWTLALYAGTTTENYLAAYYAGMLHAEERRLPSRKRQLV